MKTWKWLAAAGFLIILALFCFVFLGQNPDNDTDSNSIVNNIKVGMVADISGFDDYFNYSIYQGLNNLRDEHDLEIKVLLSSTMSDYRKNIRDLAEQGFDLIWTQGILMSGAVKEAAGEYPETHFAIVDAEVEAPNVLSVKFKTEEGSYLAGVITALMLEEGSVGFIGGLEDEYTKKYEAGYTAGINETNPSIEIRSRYTGVLDDPEAARETAQEMFEENIEIIYEAAGNGAPEIINEARKRRIFVINTDISRKELAPYYVLGSIIKNVEDVVIKETKFLINNDFVPGLKYYGLKKEGLIFSEQILSKVPPEIINITDEYKQQIINGNILVPVEPPQKHEISDEDDIETFEEDEDSDL